MPDDELTAETNLLRAVDTSTASFRHRRFRWRGAIGALVLCPAALVALFSASPFAGHPWLHLSVLTVAWAAFIAGAGFRFWATLYIGGRKEAQLVVEGPYSLCRHPLYLGSLLLGLSGALFFESPALVGALLVLAVAYLGTTVPIEERVLRAKHGERYDAYVRIVPRLWPQTWRVAASRQVTVDVHRLWLECARASRWMWLPILGTISLYLRSLAWWPHLR